MMKIILYFARVIALFTIIELAITACVTWSFDKFNLETVLLRAILFGASMAFLLFIIRTLNIRRIGLSILDQNAFVVNPRVTIDSKSTFTEIEAGLKNEERLSIINCVDDKMTIRYRDSMRSLSRIEIEVKQDQGRKSTFQYEICAKSTFLFLFFDLGAGVKGMKLLQNIISNVPN